jgi:hypothetical protein
VFILSFYFVCVGQLYYIFCKISINKKTSLTHAKLFRKISSIHMKLRTGKSTDFNPLLMICCIIKDAPPKLQCSIRSKSARIKTRAEKFNGYFFELKANILVVGPWDHKSSIFYQGFEILWLLPALMKLCTYKQGRVSYTTCIVYIYFYLWPR